MLDGVPALILRSTQGCLMLGMGGRSLSQERDILLTALLEKDQEPGSRNQLCPPNLRFVRRRTDDNTASVLSQRLESLHHRQQVSSPHAAKETPPLSPTYSCPFEWLSSGTSPHCDTAWTLHRMAQPWSLHSCKISS